MSKSTDAAARFRELHEKPGRVGPRPYKRDGRTLRAARWALDNCKTLSQAAEEWDCDVASVSEAWRRMFPDVPALLSRRGGSPTKVWPEDEVAW